MAQKGTTMDKYMLILLVVVVGILGYSAVKQSATEQITQDQLTQPTQQSIRCNEAATVTVKPWDIEANSKTLKTNVNLSIYDTLRLTSAAVSYTAFSATTDGDATTGIFTCGKYKVYVIDASYNFMPEDVVDIDMKAARQIADINVHNASLEADLQWSAYDSFGTALNAATNTTRYDYNLTMGADSTSTVKYYLKLNAPDTSFALGGFGIVWINDVKRVSITSIKAYETHARTAAGDMDYDLKDGVSYTFKTRAVPLHMQSLTFQNGMNDTAWDTVVVLDKPILMTEWDEILVTIQVETTSTDPTWVQYSTSDAFAVIAKSWSSFQDKNGAVVWDIAVDDSTETDAGLDEVDNKGYGKDATVGTELL